MGKTMFGIPGVNEKSQSGGAIAPKGTPGGSAGSENRGRSGGMSQSGQQRQQRQQPRQSTPPGKAPMAKPAMAKPMPAGTKPQPQAADPKKAPANKTMFGIDATGMIGCHKTQKLFRIVRVGRPVYFADVVVDSVALIQVGTGIDHFDGVIYFATKGDDRVWAYDIARSELELVYDRSGFSIAARKRSPPQARS